MKAFAGTVTAVEQLVDAANGDAAPTPGLLDAESRQWLAALEASGAVRHDAVARLHALLLRAARFEVARRRPALPHLRGDDLDDTPHQRRVLVALALNGVPIDVLSERLNTNRNALYKTLHDARRKLRNHLDQCGLSLDNRLEEL